MEMEIEMVMCIKRDRDKERKGERVGSDAQVKAYANLKCLAVEAPPWWRVLTIFHLPPSLCSPCRRRPCLPSAPNGAWTGEVA